MWSEKRYLKVGEAVFFKQIIEVQPWSIRRLSLYCDGGLLVHPANAESGGLRLGL